MPDVVVVGGGPVGSRVAARLAGMGHSVVVLERRQPGHRTCCTGVVSRECLDTFSIGPGTVLRTVNCGTLSPSGASLRLKREQAQAGILDRAVFDILMADRAQAAGAEYLTDSPVTDIRIDKDGVTALVSRPTGTREFAGRALVIASGFSFRLAERLGLGRVGDFAGGAQADVAAPGVDEVEVYFGHDVAPGFFAWLVPTSPGRARVGLLARRDARHHLEKLLTTLAARGRITLREARTSYGGVPLAPLSRTCGERVVVVGDAAGQVKPTSGGGIYYGLLCADLAAEALHRAFEADDLSARRLAAYERAWQRRLGGELRVDRWARQLFEGLSDRQIDRAFMVVGQRGIDRALLNSAEVSFDWHSQAIMKLMAYRAVSRAVGVVRSPFRAGKD